ncbi:transglutaminase-like domain-containing protein [Pendulispora rubella]|uniref:Transglutaminase-like domain-containing protein n=1 Tax=Pendulispora rubella TaxID=2741070 RepID=A0ABZ2LHB5_9BACT
MASSEFLEPAYFVESDHPDIVAFATEACGDASTDAERARRLFRTVRDRFRYDPYTISPRREDYRASSILKQSRAYCVTKAVVLCAAARAVGIPSRLGFADVRNHLSSEKLRQAMQTDLFVFHGYTELWIDGQPLKVSPAFNAELCVRVGVEPLEFDGRHNALLHAFDGQGHTYMEYLHDRGCYVDLPFDEMIDAFVTTYGQVELHRPGTQPDDVFQR